MDSLRGVGYSLESAVADLIDNSITARAGAVDVRWEWNGGDPTAAIIDDGSGMSPDIAVEALRFGGRGPSRERAGDDLGRFGLGLKTASLSQCRRLTVLSKPHGAVVSAFTWDLDHIKGADDRWELIEGQYTGPPTVLHELQRQSSGTAVVWEKVDFGRLEDRPDYGSFLAELERLDQHLGMVFHRFINGDARRLKLSINGNPVPAWDPFSEDNEATIRTPEQTIYGPGGRIRVRGFVLPHRDRFRTDTDYDRAGGPDGWNAQQGFYVYRSKRLLSAGGWLGLGGTRVWTREESSRLARVRVDVPNSADHEWRIDVRKAIARPPDAVKQELRRIATDVRGRAREVFIHRGHFGPRRTNARVERIWAVNPEGTRPRYAIRRNHDIIRMLRERLDAESDLLDAVLDLIERTVPVERVWLDVTERGVSAPELGSTEERAELIGAARRMVALLERSRMARVEAIAMVSRMDPFDRIDDLAESIAKKQ